MKNWTTVLALVGLLISGTAFAQGWHHGRGSHGLWPDSLVTKEVTGTVIVDSTSFHPMYFLDEDNDGHADYHLSFGPWWYEAHSGATRPADGENVTIVGAILDHTQPPTLIVFEINGLVWREPVAYGMQGWNGMPFWNNRGDTLTVTGVVMIDTTYFYDHYFLDVDRDSIPDYRLGFGPPWYEPASGATRPTDGETVTVFGRVHETPGPDMLSVYAVDGLVWRPLDQPAPWAGMWMHRNHLDTTFVYCVTDSANWVGFAPGHMGHGMGGMMWPDSAFVQFWEIHPDSLPGEHDGEQFRGFYLNMHDPYGMGMMGGRFGGRRGMMRFDREHRFQFHYDDEDLAATGRSEDGLTMRFWDDETQQWKEVSGVTVDKQANTVSFSSTDLSNYYALVAPATITAIQDGAGETLPSEFVLQQNYPNPFNPTTTIRFQLPVQAHVQLAVYNLLGQRIAVLLDEDRAAGVYSVQWDGKDTAGRPAASGVYLVRLAAGEQVKIKRMLLLK